MATLAFEVAALARAIAQTVSSDSFPLVSRQAITAAFIGIGGCWGGLWLALWLAGMNDRRVLKRQKPPTHPKASRRPRYG